MTSEEKLQKMLRLEKPGDRSEIPYFPQIMTWAGTCSGISQKDMMESVDKNIEALDITFEKVGKPDVMMCTATQDTVFIMGLPVRIPEEIWMTMHCISLWKPISLPCRMARNTDVS